LMLVNPGNVFRLPQCGQVALQMPSDIAISSRTRSTSAAGTVRISPIDPHAHGYQTTATIGSAEV